MATTAITNSNTVYDNVVLANKVEDLLTTNVDLSNYLTVDSSLAENPGMKKQINTYTAAGNVEDLAMGEGNDSDISVSYTTEEYEVGTTQGRFQYFDEQAMTDPMVVEAGLKGMSQKMVNDFTSKAIAEFGKATLIQYGATWTFDDVVDAIALMNTENEDGLFLLINPGIKADFRTNLKDDLKYSEGYVRTGYIGSVAGVPVIVSKAVPANTAYLATKEAVTLFVKKGVEVEQERDANVRNNKVYIRKVALVALTDATKVVKITSSAKPTNP